MTTLPFIDKRESGRVVTDEWAKVFEDSIRLHIEVNCLGGASLLHVRTAKALCVMEMTQGVEGCVHEAGHAAVQRGRASGRKVRKQAG